MKIKWLFIGLAFLPLACSLGPLLREANPTATPTATAIPTLAPASTEAPTVAPTLGLIPTQIPPPTSITCPRGTELRVSENKCFYVTRTPKPEDIYCPEYPNKAGCVKHGCSWNAETGTCT
jgi:hypothetical protein